MKTLDIKRSLCKKGFKESEGDHHQYFLYYMGKKTSIRTKISRNETDIGDPLIKAMAAQIKLTKDAFCDYVECKLGVDQYYEILRKSGNL